MTRILAVAVLAASLAPAVPAQSTLKIKVYIVSDETVPSSREVVEANSAENGDGQDFSVCRDRSARTDSGG